jgi:hypothetical protein
MAYQFKSEAPWNILHGAHIWHQTYRLFPALKQILDGHMFEGDCEVETVVTL